VATPCCLRDNICYLTAWRRHIGDFLLSSRYTIVLQSDRWLAREALAKIMRDRQDSRWFPTIIVIIEACLNAHRNCHKARITSGTWSTHQGSIPQSSRIPISDLRSASSPFAVWRWRVSKSKQYAALIDRNIVVCSIARTTTDRRW
jgi:hypothetical protein